MPDIHLRRNLDGQVRVFHDPWPWEEHSDYLWFEGNYSCDCNRSLFFQRAAGEEDGENRVCGEEAYTITKIVLDDGQELAGDGDG